MSAFVRLVLGEGVGELALMLLVLLAELFSDEGCCEAKTDFGA